MVIKTITCHDVYNYGASLQAYALSNYLNTLGHNVQIIDYKPYYLSSHYRYSAVLNPKYDKPIIRLLYMIAKFPKRFKGKHSKKKKQFDMFTQKYLPITDRTFASNDELKDDLPYADLYIAGSDQIWNTLFKNGRDPAFYLDFVGDNGIKASYAASFATLSIESGYKENVKKWLEQFDYISVREKSGVDIIHRLGINNVRRVMDPVFLLSESEWNQILSKKSKTDKYILIYDFDNNPEINVYAKFNAKRNGWKIYSYFKCSVADVMLCDDGPLEFIEAIKNAEMIISNSFHATAFSVIFKKEFVVFKRKEGINTRMQDLLFELGLEDHLIEDMNGNYNSIDYDQVYEKLDKYILESKLYLKDVLEAGEKCDR